MNADRSSLIVAAAAGLCCAAAACAQDCLWRSVTVLSPPETGSGAMVYDPLQARVLHIDGQNEPSLRIWRRDGATWTLLPQLQGATRRYWPQGAFDTARNRLVVFGGFTVVIGFHPVDTWEWTGTTWVQAATAGPPGRHGHRMVYDVARARVVLFGGSSEGFPAQYLGDTWEWDGSAWALRSQTGPLARNNHGMVYDPERQRTVVFGGYRVAPLGDCWEWDGTSWAERPVSGPSPRSSPLLAHDPSRSRLVLIGGGGPGVLPGEVWELEAASNTWTFRGAGGPSGGPSAYDQARGRAVLLETTNRTWECNPLGTLSGPAITQQPVGGGTYPVGTTVVLTAGVSGAAPLSYQWQRNQIPLVNGGNISGANTPALTIGAATQADNGSYRIQASNPCNTVMSNSVGLFIGSPGACYANCDASTIAPALNVMDYICFINRYGAQDPYANCDASTIPPVINVNDFTCFQNAFAAGCANR